MVEVEDELQYMPTTAGSRTRLESLTRLLGNFRGDRKVVSVRCLNSVLSCGCDRTYSLTYSFRVSSNLLGRLSSVTR